MRAGDESATAGGKGAGEEGVVRAIFRIGGAGEANALGALETGAAAEVGAGVDGERRSKRAPAEAIGPAG